MSLALVPDSWGDSLLEFNPCHSKADGTFARKGACGGAPILQGVDPEKNAAVVVKQMRSHFRSIGGSTWKFGGRAKDMKAAEEELRALPLVHGTSLYGALAAVTEGLVSAKALEGRKAALQQDIDDLMASIKADLPSFDPDDMELNPDADEIASTFGVSGPEAEGLAREITELQGIQRVLKGATYPGDRKLGLDEFVFTTHGELHQDYGPLGVVIDNSLLKEGWATRHDIVNYDRGGLEGEYSAEGVELYRKTIVMGDGYYKAAAAVAGRAEGVVRRSREQLFEIKVPAVPKKAVLGFVVHDDLDLAQTLSERLAEKGHYGKVLYISEPHYEEHAGWLNHQMKHIQETGRWDDDKAREWEEEVGVGEIFVL